MAPDDEAVTDGEASHASDPTPPGPWRRRLAIAGTVFLAIGLLGGGATFGWYLRGWVPGGGVGVKRTVVVVKRPVQVEAQTITSGTLPNVLGLDIDEARQAYADAGVDPGAIDVRSVPYVGQVGSVVEQKPAAANKVPSGGGRTQLLVAETARMPVLVGLSADEAREQLTAIGVGATSLVRYEPSVEPGQVARTEPAAGAVAEPQATLVVSEEPSSIDVADLEPVGSDCRIGDAQVRGTAQTGALLCDVYGEAVRAEYAINDRVTSFEATLELADGHPSRAGARLVARRDGRVVASFRTSGRATTVEVPLNGGSSLTLELSRSGAGDEGITAVLADARIVGARSGIDELGKTP